MKIKIIGKKNNQNLPQFEREKHPVKLVAEYEISTVRSGEAKEESETLEEGSVTELVLDDGTIWISTNEELEYLLASKNRNADGILTISSGSTISLGETNRGFLEAIGIQKLRIFNPKEFVKEKIKEWVLDRIRDKALETLSGDLAVVLDNKIVKKEEKGLNFVNDDFTLKPFKNNEEELDLEKPILLLIHGTSSNTKGSFKHFYDEKEGKPTKSWARIRKCYKNNILAFEHWTWSVSPIQNAVDLVEQFPKNTKVHLITSSRGGLVGDFFSQCLRNNNLFINNGSQILKQAGRKTQAEKLEKLRDQKKKDGTKEDGTITIAKYIRVACPANGTTLISKRADRFLNLLLNAIGLIGGIGANPIYEALKEFTIAFVAQRGNPEAIPGLEAMIPGSPILKVLNQYRGDNKYKGELCIVSAHVGNSGNVGRKILSFAARHFFGRDNDFVVDTDSMYQGVQRNNGIYYSYFSDDKTHHLSYFKNKSIRNCIWTALTAKKGEMPDGFKLVDKSDYSANRGAIPWDKYESTKYDGSKPVLVLIPGVMGSILEHREKAGENDSKKTKPNYEDIWLDYSRLVGGDLKRIFSLDEDVRTNSVIGSYYKNLSEYFKSKNYHVIVFPYDWRNSVEVASNNLHELLRKIRGKQAKGNNGSIKIIAHSMGGLVVRQLMLSLKDKKNTIWEKLNESDDFRCLLLGTPWYGSYLMAQTLLGKGLTINLLAFLDSEHNKKDLLNNFVKSLGLLELLPLEGHNFEEKELWAALEKVMGTDDWTSPKEDDLGKFADYKQDVLNGSFDLSNFYYIAGKDKETPESMHLRNWDGNIYDEKGGKQLASMVKEKKLDVWNTDLVFTGTERGDGSVTWKDGIPKELKDTGRVYYAKAKHGALANRRKYFQAFWELLEKGTTSRMSNSPDSIRSTTFELADSYIFRNDKESQLRQLLQLDVNPNYEKSEATELGPLKVTVKNGDLKFAKYPVIIGHFKDDQIMGAGMVLNLLLNNELIERKKGGLYPGDIGTHLVIRPTCENETGAIVVGLGTPDQLNAFQLRTTVEKACLEYIFVNLPCNPESPKKGIAVSSLLVGSDYGNLSLANSLNYILEGIHRANQRAQAFNKNYPVITEVEFIELYSSRANQAYFILEKMKTDLSERLNIELSGNLQKVDGSRFYTPFPFDHESGWWQRITAIVQTETVVMNDNFTTKEYVNFSATTSSAKVEVRNQFTNPDLIADLLRYDRHNLIADRISLKAVFELFIPNAFKVAFRNQQNIIWVLDEKTAEYPLEMLYSEDNDESPLCVNAGMIRQLVSGNEEGGISSALSRTSLVIGDPIIGKGSKIPQLKQAKEEAEQVYKLLKENGYNPTLSIGEHSSDVVRELFRKDYQILHIACHGVVNYGKDKKTGILLSERVILTAAEIKQIKTPELVFINCCHVGKVNAELEEHFRDKYKLAANIGTQFIKNGVKAVIVAGSAVDDLAARVFAEEFYMNMFGGYKFGEAVQKARKKCFDKFKKRNNTWGAYQCYGDPHYTLRNENKSDDQKKKYVLEKEMLIELEIFVNSAKFSSNKDHESLKDWLGLISEGIKKADRKLQTDKVIEMEAMAYYEMGVYNTAVDKYKELIERPGTNYSMSSFQTYTNIRSNLLVTKHDELYEILVKKREGMKELEKEITGLEKEKKDNWREKLAQKKKNKEELEKELTGLEKELTGLEKEKNDILQSFKNLQKIYSTSDVLAVIGGFYKNIVHWKDDTKEKQLQHLMEAANKYREGYVEEIANDNEGYYQLINWIVLEKILEYSLKENGRAGKKPSKMELSARQKEMEEIIGKNVQDFLASRIKLHTPANNHLKKDVDFWDCIRGVNYQTCMLFFVADKEEELKKLAGQIKDNYRRAWKKGGSIRNLDSEKAQIRFMLKSVKEKKEAEHLNLTRAFEELLVFFNQLDIRL